MLLVRLVVSTSTQGDEAPVVPGTDCVIGGRLGGGAAGLPRRDHRQHPPQPIVGIGRRLAVGVGRRGGPEAIAAPSAGRVIAAGVIQIAHATAARRLGGGVRVVLGAGGAGPRSCRWRSCARRRR